MGAFGCSTLWTEHKDWARRGPIGTGFFSARPDRSPPNTEVHYRCQGDDAGLLPLGRLVTVLQDPARRAGTKSGRNQGTGPRRGRHQLRLSGGAEELRGSATYYLSAAFGSGIKDHPRLRHSERDRTERHCVLRHSLSWYVHLRYPG